MSEFGNGVAVAVEALQDDLDLVDVFWCAAPEAARPGGVVDVTMVARPRVVPKWMPWVATLSTWCSTAARRSAGVSPRGSPCQPIAPPAFLAGLAQRHGLQMQDKGD
jgi:hypothetical protein